MASQQDVAKLAKVSFMTVSRVVNNNPNVRKETRERVLQAIKELSYYPNSAARALNSAKSRNIGIIFPRKDYFLVAPFCMELCFEVERRLRERDYHLLFGSLENEPERRDLSALFKDGTVGGLILFAPSAGDRGIETLVSEGFPFVVVNGRIEGVPYVDSDNRKGSSLILRYLLESGHRRIGFVSGNLDEANALDRFLTYRDALAAQGIAFDEDLVYRGDWTLEAGDAAFRRLMALADRPTAIFFSNDQMAIGAIKAAGELEIRIPDDVSITGYDDIQYASFTVPGLTTVRQNIATLGDKVSALMLAAVEGRAPMDSVLVDPDLVVRSSVRSPL